MDRQARLRYKRAMSQLAKGKPASRGRLGLALLLDYLAFSALAAPLTVGQQRHGVPAVVALGVALVAFGFLTAHFHVRRLETPGRWALGIRWDEDTWRVDPDVASTEAWWTMAVALLGAFDAAKAAARVSTGLPPPPFFGLPLGVVALHAIVTASGVVRFVASLFVFRGRPWAALLGVVFLVSDLASMLASGPAFQAWIVDRAYAQAAETGRAPTNELLEAMARYLPMGVWIAVLFGVPWLVAAAVRFRRQRKRTPAVTTPE